MIDESEKGQESSDVSGATWISDLNCQSFNDQWR